MGKYMRKCKGMGDIAVMEVGPLTRARTLALAAASGKRRKVAGAVELPLRGRRVAPEKPVSCRKSPSSMRLAADRCPSADRIVTSRCSSNGSCDQTLERLRSEDHEAGEGFEVTIDLDSGERRETTPSSNLRADYDDLDSTTAPSDSNSGRKPTAAKMPLEAEIEDFFAAAERHEHKRFVEKYNFDVKKDVPLEGRYEWVRLT
ncbi:cyclin-dependent kinase inhibitor 1-like [Aristolochia californica]|uniref:cyclin-dependent kinase inhibitor 1-like n=1 Tax=Aristolochia californica TaxID=171875 RepID=UPI0035D9A524